MSKVTLKQLRRARRKRRIRKKIQGTSSCPRLTVYKSNHYTYTQIIDDHKGHTIVAASNSEKDLRNLPNNIEGAIKLGTVLGDRVKAKKIKNLVFDRNGYAYHGIVRSIAESVRKTGIKL